MGILTDEERKEFFLHTLLPQIDRQAAPAPTKPAAVILGGQPGSGKQLAQLRLADSLAGKTWVIDPERVYEQHPQHTKLAEKFGAVEARAMMRDDTENVVSMALVAAQKRGVNIVLLTTMQDPEQVKAQALKLREGGYTVEAKVLSTPEQQSWMTLRQRDERVMEIGWPSTLPSKTVHDESVLNTVKTVALLESTRAVDGVEVIRKGLDATVYSNKLIGQEWEKAPSAAMALEAERKRPWPGQMVESFKRTWDGIEKMAADRLSGRPAEQIHAERTQMANERRRAQSDIDWQNRRATPSRAAPSLSQERVHTKNQERER